MSEKRNKAVFFIDKSSIYSVRVYVLFKIYADTQLLFSFKMISIRG